MLTQLACLNNDLYPCIISMLYMLQDYTHDRRMIVSYCGNSKTRRHQKRCPGCVVIRSNSQESCKKLGQ